MKKDTSKIVDLDALFKKASIESTPEKEIITEAKTASVSKTIPDIEAIVTEWGYRCDKGYPDFNNKYDRIKLQEVLDEMGIDLPFKRITEAPAKSKNPANDTTIDNASVSAFPPTLVKKLKAAKKLKAFEEYLKLFPGGDAIEKVAEGITRICVNKTDEDKLVALFKSTKNLKDILKIDLSTGIYAKMYNVRPSGTGPGEILISWYVIGAMFQGGNVSYDIDFNGEHWEVKSLISASGAKTPAAIDPAKYGIISKYKFATDLKLFFENIVDPYYDNKLRESIISLSDNTSVITKLTAIADLIEQLPRETPQSKVTFSNSIDEMGAAMFNKFYTVINEINSKLPKSVKDTAKASRIAVKTSSTDAQYWIDPEDVDDITKNAGKDKEISIKVGDKITDENKDAKIWLARLMSNKFIKDPKISFVGELRKIRDGFGENKAGMIYLTVGKFNITKSMDDFFTSHITRGHFRFSLKTLKSYSGYKYAQEQ